MLLTKRITEKQIQSNHLIAKGDYWTVLLGFSRSAIAFGLLLTLLFNSNEVLFIYGFVNETTPQFSGIGTISIYNVLPNIALAKWVSIFILILVISGVYPRYTCILHWWITFSYFTTSFLIDGGDQISSILTFVLIPICLTDRRSSHWKRAPKENAIPFWTKGIAFFSFLIIEIQVAFLYFHSVIGKLDVKEWVNGTALYYWFRHPQIGINENLYALIIPLLSNPFIVTFLTWGVLLFELLLFTCLFVRDKKIRKIAWITGILFHFGIILAFGLVSFFFAMVGALTLFLMSKYEFYRE